MDMNFDLVEGLEVKDEDQQGFILSSGVYSLNSIIAYFIENSYGKTDLVFSFKAEGRGLPVEIKYSVLNEKGSNHYEDRKGNTVYLSGFLRASAVVKMLCGKEIKDIMGSCVEKVVEIYDFNAKEKVGVTVNCPTDLFEDTPKIKMAILETLNDKKVKAPEQDDNGRDVWLVTGNTREANEFVKAYNYETGQTLTEMAAGSPAKHMQNWLSKNEGIVKDKTVKLSAADKAKNDALLNTSTETQVSSFDD